MVDDSSGDLTDLEHAYKDLPSMAAILLHAGARSCMLQDQNVAAQFLVAPGCASSYTSVYGKLCQYCVLVLSTVRTERRQWHNKLHFIIYLTWTPLLSLHKLRAQWNNLMVHGTWIVAVSYYMWLPAPGGDPLVASSALQFMPSCREHNRLHQDYGLQRYAQYMTAASHDTGYHQISCS